jgi:Bacteriophage baseplate protein W
MNIAYPMRVEHNGLLAAARDDDHIEQLIEQVLFTTPGERVNQPDFGTGLARYVFADGSVEIISAVQLLIQGALQQWLGNLIQIQAVQVSSDEATLNVAVYYVVKRTQQQRSARFTR